MNSAPDHSLPSPWLHRFAVALAVLSWILVFAGGLVTSKGAGLAVPDWPLSFGGINPPGWMHIENVRAEHGHRLIAGVTAILTFVLAVWIWRTESRRWLRFTAAGAFALVISQALLGGLSVLNFRPLPIVSAHALIGQTFFCLCLALALFTSPRWRAPRERSLDRSDFPLHYVCIAFIAALYAQLLMGALMRHTGSGLAIPDFPLSYGRLVPPFGGAGLDEINNVRAFEHALPALSGGQIAIHFAHRVGAIFVCAAGLWLGLRVFRRHRDEMSLVLPAALIWVVLAFQVMLGALTIWSGKQPHLATAHQATGALILGLSWIIGLEAFRAVRRAPAAEARAATAPASARKAAM